MDPRLHRRLGWALILSVAAHGLALSPALKRPALEGQAPLQATLHQPRAATPPAAPEMPTPERPVEPPKRTPLPQPAERRPDKAPEPVAPARSPTEGEAAGTPEATPTAPPSQADNGAAALAAAPPSPRPAVDVHGLRQYYIALGRMAKRFKRYPPQARDAGWEGRVAMRLSISESGMPVSIVLIGSSGFPVLDQAALEMMRMAASHTAVPEALRGEAFSIDLAADYSLRDDQ